jgi:hypothetical protein
VSSLPKAGIVEIETPASSALGQRLGEWFAYNERFLVVSASGSSLVFDAELTPALAADTLIGGAGPKTLDECPVYANNGGEGLQETRIHDLKWRFDPETCPQCGVRKAFDRDRYVYEIQNVDAFLQTTLGAQVKARFGAEAVGR